MVNSLLRRLKRLASTTRGIAPILGLILRPARGLRGDAGLTQHEMVMDRRELLLAVLAAANGREYQPAQIQKAIFLIDKNLAHLIHRGPHYNFVPYNYGPFDRNVYVEAENLRAEGLAVIAPSDNGRWSTYAASRDGIQQGKEILSRLKLKSRRYIESVCEWVLAQSFGSLVKSIYDAYPEMRANSIFQD